MGLNALETLFLNSSDIHILHPGSLSAMKSLKTLYLNDNPLVCDCHMKWFRQWVEVEVESRKNTSQNQKTLRFRGHEQSKIDNHFISPSRIICRYPARLRGMPILEVKVDDFLCSCETCMSQISCQGTVVPLCNCTKNQLVDTCSSTCILTAPELNNLCTELNNTCYCSDNSETCRKNANIYVRNGKRSCKCKDGFSGDALIECFALKRGGEDGMQVLRVAFWIAGVTVAACLATFIIGWCRLRLRRRRSSPVGVGLDWKNAIPFASCANGNSSSYSCNVVLPKNYGHHKYSCKEVQVNLFLHNAELNRLYFEQFIKKMLLPTQKGYTASYVSN